MYGETMQRSHGDLFTRASVRSLAAQQETQGESLQR